MIARNVLIALLLFTAGCDQMAEQARVDPHEVDGTRSPPAGTVARDDLGRALALAVKPATTPLLLERGRDRYAIFCTPCHGSAGDGEGRTPNIPEPPSLVAGKAATLSAEEIVRAIGRGAGAMPAMAAQLPPHDRWAVAAHVESLRR